MLIFHVNLQWATKYNPCCVVLQFLKIAYLVKKISQNPPVKLESSEADFSFPMEDQQVNKLKICFSELPQVKKIKKRVDV